jgi:Cu+-exporting ATPase
LSRAVSETTATRRPFKEFREIPGCGVAGLIECGPGSGNSHRIRLGSLRWLAEENVDVEPGAAFADEWMTRGATVLGLAVAGRLAAVYALQDSLKPGAAEVMRRLESRRLASPMRLYLVSGDSNRSVKAIATKLGIPESRVFSEVRPERKAAIIRQLQEQGERVAFVGDGINDAPALEQADLGIAVCRASDNAREAADIILLNSEIEAVPESIALAQATLRTIKQNLFWAFFYNALSVPLAALGFLSPILCAAAMGVSDLIVIGNALRLRNWKWR